MIYGKMVSGFLVVTSLEDGGKEIIEVSSPSVIPDNYETEYHWEEQGNQIVQVWDFKPIQGTEQDSMLALAKMQAQSLTDDKALKVSMLYDEWYPGRECKKDEIVRYQGKLYRVSQNHTAQSDYTPNMSGVDSLYTAIVVDSDTGYQQWQQPSGEHSAYSKGDIVTHNGKLWISTVDGVNTNTWEPGVYGWDEYSE